MPQTVSAIASRIAAIGEEMVDCAQDCADVDRDQRSGLVPRCLVFAHRATVGGRGVAFVGLNPGRMPEKERHHYEGCSADYGQIAEYWRTNRHRWRYYRQLDRIVSALGLGDQVLWTELVKCQCSEGVRSPGLETLRRCCGLYLTREITAVPPDWPLIAVGREALHALSYLCPDRTILGIPHPTGAYGQFAKLARALESDEAFLHEVMLLLKSHHAEWLYERLRREARYQSTQ